MAKTRLNQHHRTILKRFAEDNIECVKETAAHTKAYERAAKAVKDDSEKKFPPTDMKVLEKYDVGGPDRFINGGTPEGSFIRFQFTEADHAPLMPSHYCGSRSISFTQRTCDAILACEKAKTALDAARLEKLRAYRSLVDAARTFEDILEVWPAAEALRESIKPQSTALVTLSDDIRNFIKADNAGEQLAA